MSIPAREIAITYGSVTVNPDGQYRTVESFDAFTVEFDFIVTGTSASDLGANISTARTAFRKPFQDLAIVHGSTTIHTLKPSQNTGLETRSEILKEEHVVNCGLARRFHVRVTGGLPADNVTTSGLREFSVTVSYTPARRRLISISGVWTAVSGTAARAGYAAGIDTLCASTLSGLSLTVGTNCELVGEDPTASSYNDKTLTFTRVYQEINYAQAGSSDDAAIVQQQLRISIRRASEWNAATGSIPSYGSGSNAHGATSDSLSSTIKVLPFIEVSASYDAWVKFDQTTDLAGKWATIEAVVLNLMRVAAGSQMATTSIAPSYLYDDNRISAQITAIAIPTGATAVHREFSQELVLEGGNVAIPAWTGGPLAKFVYQGPSRKVLTTRLVETTASGGRGGSSSVGASGGSGVGSHFSWGGGGGSNYFANALGFGTEIDTTNSASGRAWGSGFGAASLKGADGNGTGNSGGSGKGGFVEANAGAGGDSSYLVTDTTTNEPLSIGLDTPIQTNRQTRVRVIEFYDEVATPRGYAETATPR